MLENYVDFATVPTIYNCETMLSSLLQILFVREHLGDVRHEYSGYCCMEKTFCNFLNLLFEKRSKGCNCRTSGLMLDYV